MSMENLARGNVQGMVAKGPIASLVVGQIEGPLQAFGCCDPLFRDSPSALLNFHYSTAVHSLANAAGGAAAIGMDLLTAAGASVSLFAAGVGEAGDAQGYTGINLSEVETDAYKAGAMVDRGELYVAVGMTAQILRPYVLSGAGVTAKKSYPAFLDEYEERIREAFMLNTFFELSYENTACKYRLGAPADWPGMGGPTGSIVSNGRNVPQVFMPFRAATVFNARDESKKPTLAWKTGTQGILVPNNPDVATEASNVLVPVRVQFVGFPICSQEAAGICGDNGGGRGADQQAIINAAVAAALQAVGR